jgi:phosphoribosylpyrophosphate synthetase
MRKLEDLFRIINLASNTLLNWGVNRFPDGQIQFYTDNYVTNSEYALIASIPNSEALDLYQQIINTIYPKEICINYLYGGRSDKYEAKTRTVTNVASIYKDLFDPSIIDARVTFLSPHCDELYDGMKNVILDFHINSEVKTQLSSYDLIIFPDESAERRFKPELLELGADSKKMVTAKKERDQVTGNITKYDIGNNNSYNKILVIDDICDGGATFKLVADSIDSKEYHLSVTHGIFSNDALINTLTKYDKIFTTNSLGLDYSVYPRVEVDNVW